MSHHEAAAYRARADRLRTLATQMAGSSSLTLGALAGVDTWFGRRADSCGIDLANAQRAVRDSIDDLHVQAHRFDDIAHELDAAAWAAEREATRLRALEQADGSPG